MKTKRSLIIAFSTLICLCFLYLIYRVYHARELNLQLESYMAEQIIPIQDEWFAISNQTKQSEYFIYRNEAFYINIGVANIDGNYNSYWISRNGTHQQYPVGEWNAESVKDPNGTLSWMYSIRPLSGSVVCIILEAHKPKSWTGGMGSVAGFSTWTLDTSKPDWQLEKSHSSCPFKDTELFRTALLTVH